MNNTSISYEGDRYEPFTPDGSLRPVANVNYRTWFWRVLGWDGILPIFVLAIPQVAISLGARRSLTEALAITTPILAFFVRLVVGWRHIALNHCGRMLRSLQFVVFFLAAFFLVCLDTMMMLAIEMSNGRLWANPADLAASLTLWSAYFFAMWFVMYPGRSIEPAPVPSEEAI